jgi:hypothetical protein
MPRRDEYRRKAADCLAAADSMRDPGERATMIRLATDYMRLADHVSERGTRYQGVDDRQAGSDR